MQRYFLQEVQLGEELLLAGDLDNCVEHLGRAVIVCGQHNQIMQVLQQTLPEEVFHKLVRRIPEIAPWMRRNSELSLQEEDVE